MRSAQDSQESSRAAPPRRPARRMLALLLTAAAVTACQANPETATVAVQPTTAPVRTVTGFDTALRCMDEMLWAQGKHDIYITSAGIPDATGQIAAGTKEMLITAVSKMSAKSGAFRFVDFDPTQIDVQVLSELVGLRQGFTAPSYYIRGAITQLDSNVLSSQTSAAVSAPSVQLGVSANQSVSVISVDLNLGKLVTRQILPGMSASNSISVVQSGKGANAGGVIGSTGLALNISLDRAEGFHQAVRNLIELSTIEILGKLAQVPYWECLEIDQTNPTFKAEAREWYDAMSPDDRTRFVAARLAHEGDLQESAAAGAGAADPALRDAIARYQARSDLIPSGRVDFDLYYRLLGAEPAAPASAAAIQPAVAHAAAPPKPSPASLVLDTDRGPRPAYHVEESLVMRVQPSQDGFLYCYYQDAVGTVARIFPNRYQPNAYVRGGTLVQIPPGGGGVFEIRFDKRASREAVGCVESELELGLKLPDALKTKDLEPLPVARLDDVIGQFRSIGAGTVAEARLSIEVLP